MKAVCYNSGTIQQIFIVFFIEEPANVAEENLIWVRTGLI
jgi:hypothetical protein